MKVAVVGGGVAGLSAAYSICKHGGEVVVLEKESQLGGLLSSFKIKGYNIEGFYHHVFKEDKSFFELLNELGLKDRLVWRKVKSGSIDSRGIYNLSTPLDLLRYKPLGFIEKVKLGLFVLKIRRIKNFGRYDRINAKRWIVHNVGERVYEKFFEPLLKSKYGKFADEISAAWFISRIALRADRSSSGETLGYLKGGFQILIDKLEKEIISRDGVITLNAEVKEIHLSKKRVVYEKDGKKSAVDYDVVISTLPVPLLLNILKDQEKGLERLKNIKYEGSVCVLLGVKKRLSNIYWLNLMEKDAMFGAIVEHTNFIGKENYDNDRIIYLMTYADSDSELFRTPDNKIVADYVGYLNKFFSLSNSEITWSRVAKSRHSAPVYSSEYLGYKPEPKTLNGIFLAGMPTSYPDRSINDSISSGISVARLAMAPYFSVSIVLPVFNEAKRVEQAVKAVLEETEGKNFEIVIAEDGAKDGTDKIAVSLAKQYGNVRHMHSDKRLGRGAALARAFRQCKGDILVYMDVDLATDLSSLKGLIAEIENGNDVVTGSRYVKGSRIKRTFKRIFLSRVFNSIIRLLFNSKIRDHQCGFKAFRKAAIMPVLKQAHSKHWFWDTEILILAQKKGLKTAEIPVRWNESKETTTNHLKDIPIMFKEMLKLKGRLMKKRD